MRADPAPDPNEASGLDVRSDTHHPGDVVVDALVDDALVDVPAHRAIVHAEHFAAADAVTYVAVDASTTTDPHHDLGSAATGHVEDATPDPHPAGTPVEEKPEEESTPDEPVPAHEDAVPEAHHDDAATTPDPDHPA